MATSARPLSPAQAGISVGDPYRVVIIEDSAVIRGMMSRWLTESGGFEVVARFGGGAIALNKISEVSAEVVILDVDSPKPGGADLLPQLKKINPTPKIVAVLASNSDEAKDNSALKAAGATTILERPAATRDVTTSKTFKSDFLDMVQSLGVAYRNDNDNPRSRGRVSSKPKAKVSNIAKRAVSAPAEPEVYTLAKHSPVKPHILAIGSSTGGPKALFEVFEVLKTMPNVPIVIAQHMPPLFTGILAEHLAKASGMTAKEGEHGEKVLPGHVYIAPGAHHMVLTGTQSDLRIELNQGPEENYCRPSVDPLFRSVARIFGNKALCLILTGMGHDGRDGSKDIVSAGGTLLGQDEESSVVWGMPGAVAKAGLCAEILPLKEIGPRVTSLLKGMVR